MMARNMFHWIRFFDTGDRVVVDKYRSSLSEDTLQALICGQDWMGNGLEGWCFF